MKAIIVKYKGPTNSRGSRLVASDGDSNRITVPYDYALSGEELYRGAADALCKKMNWKGRLACGWLNNDAVFVFVD